ncbi:MAG: protein-glutamate O-methyltransferase CheR [Nitrospirae bacterium]|nr:protein-glutamate O-methyltransferase CheR [Nitrospirota bacterium]
MLNAGIGNAIFLELRNFIYDKCGIFIPETKKYFIENRLMRRLQDRNLKSFEDYLYFLKYSGGTDELTQLFNAITTNETYFFREPEQLNVFMDSIVPKVTAGKLTSGVKLWCAASSTGEEPYTLSMMFKEKYPNTALDITASDISDTVLESAKKAVYNSYSIRNVPEPYMKKYFKNSGASYELNTGVKGSVRFMNINLIDDKKIKTIRGFDVIFCRNVLIYFDEKAKQKVVSNLYDSLAPGGFLFVGSSESLHNVTRAFKPNIINKVVVYQKV